MPVIEPLAHAARRSLGWLGTRVDPLGEPTDALETISVLDAYGTSLMPRTSVHQGLAAGLHLLGARFFGSGLNAIHDAVVGTASPPAIRLGARAVEAAIGTAIGRLPEQENETLWRAGVRSGGAVLRALAVSGAIFDVAQIVRAARPSGTRRTLVAGAVITGGILMWGGRRLRHRRSVIPRWPVEQSAQLLPSVGVGICVSAVGTVLAGSYRLTGLGFRWYLGRPVPARLVNAALWSGVAVAGYNAGIASIGRANEKIEPAYSVPPTSPLLSGSAESLSLFEELGLQGRRFVSDVITPEMIEKVTGEPAVAHPIRAYVGFNSMPLYSSGRAELALEELERTNAWDRSYLLLISPTGTGWVDQTVVEAAEFLTRGDIATCSVQYGRYPSFLAVQKVGLGRVQFRLLLWGIRQRLMERPPERRPKVLVFGESLGAWTASDVVMSQGIGGFDHYGIDRALWVGLPALAKWSRNGMAAGSNDLVPEGTVSVFDRHEQLADLNDEERDRLRAVILSHDNDPIAALRPELMIREPDWMRGEGARNVPDDMEWVPVNTFWQVMVDAANAMVTVPGEFGSFGHDYRGDTTRFVRDAYHLPLQGEEMAVRIDDALKRIDIERKQRLSADTPDDATTWASEFGTRAIAGGVPLVTERTRGARWFR